MVINRYWFIILGAATALGLWLGQSLLTFAGLVGFLVGGAEMLWTRHCLTGLEYDRELSARKAAWGDEITLTLRIGNRKLLPLTWLEAEECVPAKLGMTRARIIEGASGPVGYLRNQLTMLPYEQVVRRYVVGCRRRGLYHFGPARLESGDLLGYTTRQLEFDRVDDLVVYPKLFELEIPTPLSRRIVGMQAANRTILTDPSRTIGVRAYQPGDPLRHVEWRASARSHDLLVRIFEPTTDLALAVFLNFRVPTMTWISDGTPELEFAISLAASLARWGLERKYPVGMFGNGALGETGGLRVPVSGDPGQLVRILESLALSTAYGQKNIGEVLLDEASSLPFEASVVLITTTFDERVLAGIDEVRRRRPVTVWYIKTTTYAPDLRLPGLPVVTLDFDDDWEKRDYLQLAA
jgi:uncharacterized protein (DUF58 family)